MDLDSESLADGDGTGGGDPVVGYAVADGPRMETPEEARRSIRRWVGGMAFFFITFIVVGGLLLKVHYVALVPGSARDTEPLLTVEGIRAYPSDGKLYLTTVRVRQRPNLWEYLWLKADDDAEVVPEEYILGDRTPEENKEENLHLMDTSKHVAIAVALEELGYDAVRSDAVLVSDVVEDSAAEGILNRGDAIVAIDGTPVTNITDLIDTLAGHAPGDEVQLSVERYDAALAAAAAANEGSGDTPDQGRAETVSVVLGDHPDRPGSGFLGIQPIDRLQFANDFDFHIDIDSGEVGGPSAGLAFTLAILDDLTPGELTGGQDVAVTGVIYADGGVGPVGGVPQKTAAVRDLGVKTFIVPSALGEEQIAQLREIAGDELEIIPVATVDEALDALSGLGGDVDAVREYAQAAADGPAE